MPMGVTYPGSGQCSGHLLAHTPCRCSTHTASLQSSIGLQVGVTVPGLETEGQFAQRVLRACRIGFPKFHRTPPSACLPLTSQETSFQTLGSLSPFLCLCFVENHPSDLLLLFRPLLWFSHISICHMLAWPGSRGSSDSSGHRTGSPAPPTLP